MGKRTHQPVALLQRPPKRSAASRLWQFSINNGERHPLRPTRVHPDQAFRPSPSNAVGAISGAPV
jgi:hypothetical protein